MMEKDEKDTNSGLPPGYPASVGPILELLDKEIDRQLQVQSRSLAGISTRASLLISASLVFVSIPRGTLPLNCFDKMSLVFAGIGSVFGMITLLIGSSHKTVDIRETEKMIWNEHILRAQHAISGTKISQIHENVDRLKCQAQILSLGFLFMVLALILTIVSGLVY